MAIEPYLVTESIVSVKHTKRKKKLNYKTFKSLLDTCEEIYDISVARDKRLQEALGGDTQIMTDYWDKPIQDILKAISLEFGRDPEQDDLVDWLFWDNMINTNMNNGYLTFDHEGLDYVGSPKNIYLLLTGLLDERLGETVHKDTCADEDNGLIKLNNGITVTREFYEDIFSMFGHDLQYMGQLERKDFRIGDYIHTIRSSMDKISVTKLKVPSERENFDEGDVQEIFNHDDSSTHFMGTKEIMEVMDNETPEETEENCTKFKDSVNIDTSKEKVVKYFEAAGITVTTERTAGDVVITDEKLSIDDLFEDIKKLGYDEQLFSVNVIGVKTENDFYLIDYIKCK
jgi:hypothetical protein